MTSDPKRPSDSLLSRVVADGEGGVVFEDLAVREFLCKLGEKGVAGVVLFDVGDDQRAEPGQQGAVDFGTADDVGGACLAHGAGDFARIVDDGDAGMAPAAVAGEHDVLSLGQGSTNGIEGFAAHDDGVAAGGFFEKGEVFGKVPRQGVVAANDTFRGHGDNANEGEWAGHGLDGNGCFDGGVGIVMIEPEVIKAEIR